MNKNNIWRMTIIYDISKKKLVSCNIITKDGKERKISVDCFKGNKTVSNILDDYKNFELCVSRDGIYEYHHYTNNK